MSRSVAAAAVACTAVLLSTPSEARPSFRLFSSGSKIMSAKPAAAAAAPARSGNNLFIWSGSRPAAAAGTPQPASDAKAPSPFDPSLVPAAAKNADLKANPKALTASSTDCAMKEPAPAKDTAKEKETMAALEPAKAEPTKTEAAKIEPPKAETARPRSAFLMPVVNRHPLAPQPRRMVVCYIQRDGTCTP